MRRLIMSRLIWIYAVCKSLLLSPVAVKELKGIITPTADVILIFITVADNSFLVFFIANKAWQFTWNIKFYFFLSLSQKKKEIGMSSATILLTALRVHTLFS